MISQRHFLMLHGAGATGWFWHRVTPLLEHAGHIVVCPTLPAADPAAGLTDYVDHAVRSVAEFSDERFTVVAQSMAGLIAPLLVDRLLVDGIILVAPMIPAPGERGGEWWGNTGQEQAQRTLFDRLGLDPADGMNPEVVFKPGVPDDVWAESGHHQREQSGRPFGDPNPMTAWPEIDTHVLAPVDDLLFPLAFQQRVTTERLNLDVNQVPGGHLAALSHPEPLADSILKIAAGGTERLHPTGG